jgi:hypothetical protein
MTANEMANKLEFLLDRANSFGSPGYTDGELSFALSSAQIQYVKRFYNFKNNAHQTGFEETEARGQGLSALIQDSGPLAVSNNQVGTLPNGTFYSLPEDFMFTIYELVFIDRPDCNGNPTEAGVKVVSHDEYSLFKGNYYKRPFANNIHASVFRMYFNPDSGLKRHEIITDGTFSVNSYRMRYLKNPVDITVNRQDPPSQVDCELDEFTHEVIVDIARDLMLETVKEQKLDNEIDIENFE